MPSSQPKQLEQESLSLEQEVERARGTLERLQTSLRAISVEAQAARDPRQFRSSLLASRLSPGAIAGPVGFFLGLSLGTCLVMAIRALLAG
jgi:hypothetical protein